MKIRTSKRLIAFLMALTMAASAVSCGKSEPSEANSITGGKAGSANNAVAEIEPAAASSVTFEKTEGDPDRAFTERAADFAVELLKKSADKDIRSGKNAVVSPESVMFALALTENGAGGETLAEFEKLLGGDMKTEDINKALNQLMTAANSDENVKFKIANSIWVRDDENRIRMKKEFAEINKKRFDADSFAARFDDDTLGKLNGWVSDRTDGMIPKMLEKFSDSDVAVLLNCVCFNAEWAEEYNEDQILKDQTFRSANDGDQKCTMLSSKENIYLSDENAEGFMKYYKGGRYAFAALLPKEGMSTADYIGTLTGEKLVKLIESRETGKYDVFTKIPEFSFDWDTHMADALKDMGLKKAFDADADFSNMAETASGQLFISDVIHKTHFELDRKGTKAAAATAVIMCDGITAERDIKETRNITLDRPFVMAIVDTQTNIPVFIGAVNTPA